MPVSRARRRTRPKKFDDERVVSYSKTCKNTKVEPVQEIDESSNHSISTASSTSTGRPRRSITTRRSTVSTPAPPPPKKKGRSKKVIPVVESDDEEIPAYDPPSDVEMFDESEQESSEEEKDSESDIDEEEEEEESDDNNDESVQVMRNKLDIALRFYDKNDIPELELPESSKDLVLPNKYLFRALGIYESIQRFYLVLRISPFRFEDFSVVLMMDEQSYLLSEIHICFLKALMREDEMLGTHYCAQEFRDSLNAYLLLCDHLTWPEILRIYLSADIQKNSHIIKNLLTHDYPFVDVEKKLEMLEFLLEEFMNTIKVRESVNLEGLMVYDEHCRVCTKGGDLICCESCPATFHLACLDPPLRSVPTESWGCPLCKQNAVSGVTDCKLEPKQYGGLSRHEPIGYDRYGRKFWFLSRRLFVEDCREGHEDSLFYYSTKHQFDELLDSIDENDYEEDLYKTLKELEEVIIEQMGITERLTKSAKGSRKSYIEAINEELALKRAHKLRLENAEVPEISETLHSGIDNLETGGGIQTRLRTGTIQPKNANSDALKNKSSVYNLISSFRDEDYLIVFNESGQGLTKIHKKSVPSDFYLTDLFKLGLEGNYKNYQNLFVTNVHALSKAQQNEERDRKKHLQARFSIHVDLKWGEYNNVAVQVPINSQFGNKDSLINVVKQALLHLESKIPILFFHPLWISSKAKWMQAVTMSKEMKNFSLAFNILESHLKPLIFTSGFHDLLGFTILQRSTQLEREDLKKKDKKEKGKSVDTNEVAGFDNEFANQGRYGTLGNGVKLIKVKLRHQIWKSRGEEFRLSGVGGWRWSSNLTVSVTDRVHSKPEFEKSLDVDSVKIEDDVIDISKDLQSDQRQYYTSFSKEDWNVLLERRLEMLQVENVNKASLPNNSSTENNSEVNVASKSNLNDSSTENTKPKVYSYRCYSCLCNGLNCYSPLCSYIRKEHSSQVKNSFGECKSSSVTEEKIYHVIEHVDLRKVVTLNNSKVLASKTYNWSQRARKVPTDRFKCEKYLSYFFLTHEEHLSLARRAGDKEIVGFNYAAKSNLSLWNYGLAPRPNFRLHWLMRTLNLQSVSATALQLRVLFSSIRWDDLKAQPPASGTNTITSETDVTTIELVAKRDLPPCGLRSEYKIRKIVVPLEIPTVSRRDSSTPTRSGLRTRKKPEVNEIEGPRLYETWTPEEQLELWQIKQYQHNQQIAKHKENTEAARKKNEEARKLAQAQQQQKAQATTPTTIRVTQTSHVTIPTRPTTVVSQRPIISNQILSPGTSFAVRIPNGQLIRIPGNIRPTLANGQQVFLKTTNNSIPVLMRSTNATIGGSTPRVIVGSFPRTIGVGQTKTTTLRPTGMLTPTTTVSVDSQGNPVSTSKVQYIPLNKNVFFFQPNQLSVTTKEEQNKTLITSGTPETSSQKVILKSSVIPSKSTSNVVVIPASTISTTTIPTLNSTNANSILSPSTENKELSPVKNEESETDGKMVITAEMTQEIIRKALMNESGNTAISQKLMAFQKHHQDQKLEHSGSFDEDETKDPSYKQPRISSLNTISRTARKSRSNRSTKSPFDSSDYVYSMPKSEKKERPVRNAIIPVEKENVEKVCQNIVKNLLDTIEREEKKRKQDVSAEGRKLKKVKFDRIKYLNNHNEVLRRYIARKKAKFNLQIRQKTQSEIFAHLKALRIENEPKPVSIITLAPSKPSQNASSVTKSSPNVSPTVIHSKRSNAGMKRKYNEDINGNEKTDSLNKTPKIKRQRTHDSLNGGRLSDGSNKKSKSSKLFCVCRQPYDNRSFMAGCDSCPNWYHPPCIGMSEADFSTDKPFTCPECVQANVQIKPIATSTPHKRPKGRPRNSTIAKEVVVLTNNNNNNNQDDDDGKVYCICNNQTYGPDHFLVSCDDCQNWFHGRCVGITQAEADSLDRYQCPQCAGDSSLNTLNQMTLHDAEFKELSNILKSIQTHRDAWPFLRPVDKKQVPDYYDIIKEPMDLKKIESRIISRSYQKLGEFVYDMNKMFENCRLYNARTTIYYLLADKLETFFLTKMKSFRENFAKN